jgi:predicted nucleic acid-binding protein
MRVFLDTSIIVDVDRGKKKVINVCRKLTAQHEALISTVTVSEILTGSYLRKDYTKAVTKAKKVLGQFSWVNLDGTVAEKIAQLNAYLITEGQPIEYQDQAIAASCLMTGSDILLTENKEHFSRIPVLKNKVFAPEELERKL